MTPGAPAPTCGRVSSTPLFKALVAAWRPVTPVTPGAPAPTCGRVSSIPLFKRLVAAWRPVAPSTPLPGHLASARRPVPPQAPFGRWVPPLCYATPGAAPVPPAPLAPCGRGVPPARLREVGAGLLRARALPTTATPGPSHVTPPVAPCRANAARLRRGPERHLAGLRALGAATHPRSAPYLGGQRSPSAPAGARPMGAGPRAPLFRPGRIRPLLPGAGPQPGAPLSMPRVAKMAAHHLYAPYLGGQRRVLLPARARLQGAALHAPRFRPGRVRPGLTQCRPGLGAHPTAPRSPRGLASSPYAPDLGGRRRTPLPARARPEGTPPRPALYGLGRVGRPLAQVGPGPEARPPLSRAQRAAARYLYAPYLRGQRHAPLWSPTRLGGAARYPR